MKVAKKHQSQDLWKKAKRLIPGGTQLLSKRAEMFLPDQWPAYFKSAKGVEITDLDGRTYIDMSLMGVGACVLGYADPDVNRAVIKVINNGSLSTLNSPEEVELAEVLLKLHPWAQMVRYARTGGEAMSVAIRIGRAFSKKDKVAFCGYHGWHDWYLSSNLANDKNLDGHLLAGLNPLGVPRPLTGLSLPFRYNHIEELEAIVKQHDIGVIAIEPIRHQEPHDHFLEKVRDMAERTKAVLVFDEVSAGFRLTTGGAHLLYHVEPDVAVFAKAMSNGFPMAAVIGKAEVMDTAQESFISSTFWTERIGPTAALATIKKFQDKKVAAHLVKIGSMIDKGWQQLAQKHHLNISTLGPPCLVTLVWNYPNASEIKTLFTQEMLSRGFLVAPSVYVSYAHKPTQVKKYLQAVDQVFAIISQAIQAHNVPSLLKGPVVHQGFQRLTD